MTVMTLEDRYQALCLENGWQVDPCQQQVLQKVAPIVERSWQKKRWYQRRAPSEMLYLYGAVGRGKTMLATLVFEAASVPKARWHFTTFLQHLHTEFIGENLAMPQRFSKLFASYQLLFVDELHIYDIGDAMIFAQVLPWLYQHRMGIIFTSNQHPQDLYRMGLHQERFWPTIRFLEEKSHIISVDNAHQKDYRTAHVKHAEVAENMHQVKDIWALFQQHHMHTRIHATEIGVHGRCFVLLTTTESAAFLDMAWMISQNLGAADFLAIAQRFRVVYLQHPFTQAPEAASREKLQRFMVLIDVLYDQGVEVYMTPMTSPQALQAFTASLPFERTWSRMQEMHARSQGAHPSWS